MKDFIAAFVEIFDEKPTIEITPETKFKDIPGWDSLVALSLIVMISNHYRKSIDGEIVRSKNTIRDLYEAVNE